MHNPNKKSPYLHKFPLIQQQEKDSPRETIWKSEIPMSEQPTLARSFSGDLRLQEHKANDDAKAMMIDLDPEPE